MSLGNIIDCTNSQPPLRPEDWIGRGVEWPPPGHTVPEELDHLYKQHFTVPMGYTIDMLYDPAKAVSAFIDQQLQTQSKSLTYHRAPSYFSRLAPNTAINIKDATPIPPVPLLHEMKKVSGQALLDGAASIEYPPSSQKRYSLWILPYWLSMCDVLELQSAWLHSLTALVFTSALEELNQLECDGSMTALGARGVRTSILARLVSDAWISDDIIDLMVEHVMNRVQLEPELAANVIVAHLAVVNTIMKAQSPAFWGSPSQRHLASLETKIDAKSVQELYLPVFWAEWSHWIAIRISFVRKEVAYGDSLARKLPKPQKVLEKILWWLSSRFSGQFRVVGRKLESGEQIDSYSCGICAMNAISHSIFGDILWTDSRKAVYRARWFQDICQEHGKTKTLEVLNETRISYRTAAATTSGASPTSQSSVPLPPVFAPTQSDLPSPPLPPSRNSPVTATLRISDLEIDICPTLDVESQAKPAESSSGRVVPKPRAKQGMKDLRSFFSAVERPGREVSVTPTKSVTKKTLKRKRPTDAADERPRKRDAPGVIGVSRSNKHSSAENQAVNEGTLILKPARLQAWKFKVRDIHDTVVREQGIPIPEDIDPIEFPDPQQGKVVRHVHCGNSITMKCPCNTHHWKTHIQKCLVEDESTVTKARGAGMPTLSGLLSSGNSARPLAANPSSSTKPLHRLLGSSPLPVSRPCPGLDIENFPEITSYLSRPGALGGGARSISVISRERFKKPFSKLSLRSKREVRTVQRHEWVWRNEHDTGKVFAIACEKSQSPSTQT
ncbi:hypothetical protein V8D89_008873 [Ganoderma adspersum]